MPGKNGEIGKVGQFRQNGIFYEEFIRELAGRKGVEAYKEMSDNDEVIYAMLFAIEMLMRQTEFKVEPASTKEIDKRAAEFVEECMNDMQYTWQDTLSEIISFIKFGWSYHEIVYKRRNGKVSNPTLRSKYDDGLIGWKKLPIRSQDTLYEWKYDENTDELIGMVQAAPPHYNQVLIPIEKALHFVTKSTKSNPEGKSILRGAYRPWYFKKRIQEIEGIGIERDLAGFPVLYGPDDIWDDTDESKAMLASAEGIVTSIRRDSREGLVVPESWRLELLASGSKRNFDTNAIIERYNKLIAMTALADFIFLGQQAVGSFALSSNKTKLFSVAIGTYLDVICEVFNNQAIPRLIDINGDAFKGITDYPKMTHTDIEDPNLVQLAEFVSKMAGCGAITLDENLEDFVRQAANLPERLDDYETPGNPKKPPKANNKTTDGNSSASSLDDDEEEIDPEEEEEDLEEAKKARKSLGRQSGKP